MSRAARLARLERSHDVGPMPWLTLSASWLDNESEAVGFEDCPLLRASGEPWKQFEGRVQEWARAQDRAGFCGIVTYREGATP